MNPIVVRLSLDLVAEAAVLKMAISAVVQKHPILKRLKLTATEAKGPRLHSDNKIEDKKVLTTFVLIQPCKL